MNTLFLQTEYVDSLCQDSTAILNPVEQISTISNAIITPATIIITFAIIVSFLLLTLFLIHSQQKESKKLKSFLAKRLNEIEKLKNQDNTNQTKLDKNGVIPVENGEFPSVGVQENVLIENERLKNENELLCQENIELQHKLQAVTEKDNQTTVDADNDSEYLVQFFAQKQISFSRESLQLIFEKGDQWIEELDALPIKNNDNKITFILLLKTLMALVKVRRRDTSFVERVFKRYEEFIKNPGKLNVRDKKEDEILFLKNSIELSVLFRDFIKRHKEPEIFQPGKPQNINFEMIRQDLLPSQILAKQNNIQFDGSDIPSSLLAYSLICNMHNIEELDVFISGDKIQKNIR